MAAHGANGVERMKISGAYIAHASDIFQQISFAGAMQNLWLRQ